MIISSEKLEFLTTYELNMNYIFFA